MKLCANHAARCSRPARQRVFTIIADRLFLRTSRTNLTTRKSAKKSPTNYFEVQSPERLSVEGVAAIQVQLSPRKLARHRDSSLVLHLVDRGLKNVDQFSAIGSGRNEAKQTLIEAYAQA